MKKKYRQTAARKMKLVPHTKMELGSGGQTEVGLHNMKGGF